MTECAAFTPDQNTFSIAYTSGNDMGCRMYHLTAAASSTTNAVTHCQHIHAVSPVCTGDAG